MAERKIFAGARVKRLRMRLALSQTQMAADLGLSPSYLNLIERDQRPLTVQVLLKLSSVYSIDLAELSGEDRAATVERLREVFSDPLLAGEIASPSELSELAEAAPNAARGVARLHEAYREVLERLSDLSQAIATEGSAPPDAAARLPYGQALAYFEEAGPWFAELEEASEAIAERLRPRDDPAAALKAHLRDAFGVDTRILPSHVMPVEQARYDRHSLRLFISGRVPLIERPFLMARQAVLLGQRELLERLASDAGISDAEAARIVRLGFARRLAEAMLAPASRLSEAARLSGSDIIRLSERFMLRPSRVMARLATLGGGGNGMPAAFLVVMDESGGVLSRIPGVGFPFPRLGPFCARLPIFDGIRAGRQYCDELVLPDSTSFLVLAVAEEGEAREHVPPPRRLAMIGFRRDEAGVLAREWPARPARPIGVTCRLCERLDCAHRVHPPVTRPAAFHDHVVGPSDYEVAG